MMLTKGRARSVRKVVERTASGSAYLRCFFVLVVAAGSMMVLLPGCEGGKEDFLSCKLDPILTDPSVANRPCTASFEGAVGSQETCVVDPHPQCATDICVAWSGSSPFCTETCATDAECPGGAVCLGYGVSKQDPSEPADRYCVKIDAIACETDADCPGTTCKLVAAGTNRCAAP